MNRTPSRWSRLSVPIEALDHHAGAALDDLIEPRNAEAPLDLPLRTRRLDDSGIHQHARLYLVFPDVIHEHAKRNPDLGAGQTDPVRRVHRLEEIVHEGADVVIDRLHLAAHLPQNGIAQISDLAHAHPG